MKDQIQKSIVFLYTNSEKFEMKLKNNSIHNRIKRNKIIRNKFNESARLCTRNHNIVEKIKEDLNKWKDIRPMFMDWKI